MTAEQFCYWLQGMFEIGGVKHLDENQVQIIKDHLALVFQKETPNRSLPYISSLFDVSRFDTGGSRLPDDFSTRIIC